MKTQSHTSSIRKEIIKKTKRNSDSTYYVYILQCVDGTLYTGSTHDVEKRIRAHNLGKIGAKYTRARRPVTLIYSETYTTKSDALKREYQIKKLSRIGKRALIDSFRNNIHSVKN